MKFADFYGEQILNKLKSKMASINLAHYTTADTAYKILKNKEFWMRNSRLMNDHMEIEHGVNSINDLFRSGYNLTLKNTLDSYDTGWFNQVVGGVNFRYEDINKSTYITCMSEWVDGDSHGRLSMWRAYGSSSSVAIILNKDVFFDNLSQCIFVSKVVYGDARDFPHIVDDILKSYHVYKAIHPNGCDDEVLFDMIENAFIERIISSKHVGFSEENEWRVWCNEDVFSGVFDREIECLAGVVQDVYKIKFCGNSKSVSGLSADRLIQKIVIGPSSNQAILKKAFISLLEEAGVSNADAKVEMSGIPLRV